MSLLVTMAMAAQLTACAGSSSASQSGSDVEHAQLERAATGSLTAIAPTEQRTLACLHCAP